MRGSCDVPSHPRKSKFPPTRISPKLETQQHRSARYDQRFRVNSHNTLSFSALTCFALIFRGLLSLGCSRKLRFCYKRLQHHNYNTTTCARNTTTTTRNRSSTAALFSVPTREIRGPIK